MSQAAFGRPDSLFHPDISLVDGLGNSPRYIGCNQRLIFDRIFDAVSGGNRQLKPRSESISTSRRGAKESRPWWGQQRCTAKLISSVLASGKEQPGSSSGTPSWVGKPPQLPGSSTAKARTLHALGNLPSQSSQGRLWNSLPNLPSRKAHKPSGLVFRPIFSLRSAAQILKHK